ncbi:MAG: sigma-70 family RNA polymerase sigma factor [Rubrivivax sp.]|nr:sigma-70 family RNA polymerase sigma factor [Rubrivivax sp.]
MDRDPPHRGAVAAAPDGAARALQQLLQGQRARVVAHLARALGLAQLALAEDAVQIASLKALRAWPQQGVPDNPAGWLYRVAQRAALDTLRAQRRELPWPEDGEDAADALPRLPPPAGRFAGELDDEQLALLFAACHPALPEATQVALALRLGAGLELAPIAAGLLCSEAALAQRLARARRQLASQALQVPAGDELPPRREAVLTALSLAFHAGARERARGHRIDGADALQLCWESIRLARALAAHPAVAHADADALAALLLLHGARLTGQLDEAGDIVPLAYQPRDRWDAGMVRLGFLHLQRAQRGERLSRWHLQAGIAAEHARAPSAAATDWAAIVQYYELLLRLDGSAAPRLGHAIALAEAGDPQAALVALQQLQPGLPAVLQAHGLAARARALQRLGRAAEAAACLQQAVAAAQHPAEARLLQRQARAQAETDPPAG